MQQIPSTRSNFGKHSINLSATETANLAPTDNQNRHANFTASLSLTRKAIYIFNHTTTLSMLQYRELSSERQDENHIRPDLVRY